MPELQLRLNATQHRLLRRAAATTGKPIETFAVDAATYEADRIMVVTPWATSAAPPPSDDEPPAPGPVFTVHAVER